MVEKSAKAKGKPKQRQSRRVKATRLKLLNAARDMFAEKGFDSTTIDDITERAEQVGADQVGHGGGDEDNAKLPLRCVHRVHHPQRQGGLQHAYTHVGEGNGAWREEGGEVGEELWLWRSS